MGKLWLGLAALVCCTQAAAATARPEPNYWAGLGGGFYTAQDYPDDDPSDNDDQKAEVGGPQTHFTFNMDGARVGGRFRWTHMFNFTNNAADEMAAEVRLAVADDRRFWVAAGIARMTDVSNKRKAPTVGVPLEVMFYPVRGLELSVHANLNKDKSYIGFGVAGAIGRRR
jgi:hypothetical protein